MRLHFKKLESKFLEVWEEGINGVVALPPVFFVALMLCTVWFIISFMSNGGSLIHDGKFDPGMTVGGYIVNAIQLICLFTASFSASRGHKKMGEKIDKLHKHVHHATGFAPPPEGWSPILVQGNQPQEFIDEVVRLHNDPEVPVYYTDGTAFLPPTKPFAWLAKHELGTILRRDLEQLATDRAIMDINSYSSGLTGSGGGMFSNHPAGIAAALGGRDLLG